MSDKFIVKKTTDNTRFDRWFKNNVFKYTPISYRKNNKKKYQN